MSKLHIDGASEGEITVRGPATVELEVSEGHSARIVIMPQEPAAEPAFDDGGRFADGGGFSDQR